MTPEEVFEQLRDVHLPEIDAVSVGGLDPRPLIVFAIIVAVLWLAQLWAKRRAAETRLKTDVAAPPSDQRDQLVRAMHTKAKRKPTPPVPQSAFAEPDKVTEGDVRDLRNWALRRMQ